MNEVQFLKEARYYLKNEVTIKDTADYFGVSLRTIQLHFKKLYNFDPEIAKALDNKKTLAQQQGRINGGRKGKKESSFSLEQIVQLANDFLESGNSIREFSENCGISRSTLYGLLTNKSLPQDLRSKIEKRFIENKKISAPGSTVTVSGLGIIDDGNLEDPTLHGYDAHSKRKL